MFYSHEVLTSRKYGVATVWLVATLGTASERRKVKRAEIEGVDVSKACETITSTETPLALRLQSNLLFGVSRVYSQQCTFVLKDAETVRTQVRTAMVALRVTTTTSSSSRVAKSNQITLEEDPHFALDVDLMPGLDFDYEPYHTSQDLGIYSLESQSRNSLDGAEPETQILDIPSDDFSVGQLPFDAGPQMRQGSPASSSSLGRQRRGTESLLRQTPQPASMLDDPGFEFDSNTGDIIHGTAEERAALQSTQPAASRSGSAYGALGFRIPSEQHRIPAEDLDLPLNDDLDLFPDAAPLDIPPRDERGPLESLLRESSKSFDEEEQSEDAAVAPIRAQRRRRAIQADSQMEMANSEYLSWERDYPANMNAADKPKNVGRLNYAARVNAHHWIEVAGIFDLGNNIALPSQLQLFAGDSLFEALARRHDSAASSKRSHSEESSSKDRDERRVRPRLSSEVGRGDGTVSTLPLDLDNPILPLDDDLGPGLGGDEPSVELGRHGETPLADPSGSHMPWNLLSSVHGSSARGRSGHPSAAGARQSSSVAGEEDGGFTLAPSLRQRSAAPSPLGRYTHPTVGGDDVVDSIDDIPPDGGDPMEGIEVHGEGGTIAAAGDTQLSWMSGGSNIETENFYNFVVDGLTKKKEVDEVADDIDFEELLNPEAYGRDVAAQGLMHVLALHGRQAIKVEQGTDVGFLPLVISVM